MKLRLLAAVAVLGGALLVAEPVHADTGLAGYAVSVSANVFQLTEDYPTASAHPLVELDGAYTSASLDASRAHALSAAFWPGSIGAHAGTLLAVLGISGLDALNYPLFAEAPSSTGAPEQTFTTGSAVMTASTKSAGLNQQTSEASATATSLDLGMLTFQTPTSHSVANLDQGSGKLTATATSTVGGINLAGAIKIGAINTSVTATSSGGAPPVVSGTTDYSDFTIAGQAAYVDSAGVHLGTPAKPSGSGALDVVNTALKAIGMQIYFSSSHQVNLGGTAYFYPASILILFQPPGDSNHDSITIALGGAFANMTVAAIPGESTPATSSVGTGTGDTGAFPTSTGGATLQFPTTGGTPPSLPTGLAAAPAPGGPSAQPSATPATQLAVAVPHGLGVGWLLLLLLAAVLGAAALPRIPALLRAAAPPCDDEAPWSDDAPH